jgi:hypothetical protein
LSVSQYYRSKFLADPVVYVQDKGEWRSYALGGVICEHDGNIPESIMGRVQSMDEREARTLIEERLEEADRIEAEHAAHSPGSEASASADYDGKQKLWGVLPPWALIPIAAGLALDAFGAAYGVYWLHFIGVGIWALTWLRVRPTTKQAGQSWNPPRKKDNPWR